VPSVASTIRCLFTLCILLLKYEYCVLVRSALKLCDIATSQPTVTWATASNPCVKREYLPRDKSRAMNRMLNPLKIKRIQFGQSYNLSRVLCPVRELIDMVDIISINSCRNLFPFSGADNTALGPFYLVFLWYKNYTCHRSKS
jgi:hypothetical protein